MVLSIDPGTGRTGWAAYSGPLTPVADGVVEWEYTSPLDYLAQLTDWLVGMDEKYDVSAVATERMFMSPFQGKAAALLNVSVNQIAAWCDAKGIPCVQISNGTVKKNAAGRGNAKKREVLAAMRSRLSKEAHALTVPLKGESAPIFDIADAHAVAQSYFMDQIQRTRKPKAA
jgi:Holliday junction resolvasome RuvABC endonuclease subunit